jgi:F420-0:gamma-glutamyl ligase
MPLSLQVVKTGILFPPKDDVFSLFDAQGFDLQDGDLLCLATKCLSIHQGRCIKIGTVDKWDLIIEEADVAFPVNCSVTVKDKTFIPFSGIDESNGNGYYILWPENVTELLNEIHTFLCAKFKIEKLGIMSIDSKITPLRRGTIGVAQGIFGFNPVKNCLGNLDIHGRPLRLTSVNIADSLASTACYLMGEGNECCPIVVIRGAENLEFGKNFSLESLVMPDDIDMFAPLIKRISDPSRG